MSFAERLAAINAKLLEILQADAGLAEVKTFILGERTRAGNLEFPAVWIFPEESPITNDTLSIGEDWRLRYTLVGLTEETEDAAAGKAAAEALALKAAAILIQTDADPNLNNRTLHGLCSDIRRVQWSPGQTRGVNRQNLYGAGVTFDVILTTHEA